jgi:hypothetical protein
VLSKCAYEKVGYSILDNIYEFKLLQWCLQILLEYT